MSKPHNYIIIFVLCDQGDEGFADHGLPLPACVHAAAVRASARTLAAIVTPPGQIFLCEALRKRGNWPPRTRTAPAAARPSASFGFVGRGAAEVYASRPQKTPAISEMTEPF